MFVELLGFSPQNFYFHHTFVHFVGEVKHTVFHKGVGRAGNAGVLCTLLGSRLVLCYCCHWKWGSFSSLFLFKSSLKMPVCLADSLSSE